MPGTTQAPGLTWKTRRDGTQVAYWRARKDLVKAGYQPKTVRLHYAADDAALATHCQVLQAEMLDWATNRGKGRAPLYDGTFASLVRFYEAHPDSPYHELEQATQRTYSKTMAGLMRHKGARRVDAVVGADIRRWYKELTESHSKGWAYYTINILKAVLSFGATMRLTECRELRAELREAKFGGRGPKRKEYLTYGQVIAFRDQARAMGMPWMGLLVLMQFETGMRRRDLIGIYTQEPGVEGIRYHGRLWQDGLTWGHINPQGVLRKIVSKTRFTSEMEAVHVIADYPELAAELAAVPLDRRVGPIILDPRTGVPPTESYCRAQFRRIGRRAGIPDEIWQADARAGANTEAREAGATEDESMALLTHTEAKTNQGYDREHLARSRRAAAKRVASRNA